MICRSLVLFIVFLYVIPEFSAALVRLRADCTPRNDEKNPGLPRLASAQGGQAQ